MVKNFKCPGCGASMVFKEGTSEMTCPYCGRNVSIKEAEREEKEQRISPDSADPGGTGQDETDGMGQEEGLRTYHCPNCGAEIMTDENTAATFCSFCGKDCLLIVFRSFSFNESDGSCGTCRQTVAQAVAVVVS